MKRGSTARITEVFSSIQGEGLRLGEAHIFVRFAGCNRRCRYCDEKAALRKDSGAPWSHTELKEAVAALADAGPHKALCWTGGEPLLQAGFLARAMRWAGELGLENHLETNSTLVPAFRRVLRYVDTVAADVKLPSAGGRAAWTAHDKFFRLLPKGSFVKVVLTAETTWTEWEKLLDLMKRAAPTLPLVMQPVTASKPAREVPHEKLFAFLAEAKDRHRDVRLIPQWHKIWGIK